MISIKKDAKGNLKEATGIRSRAVFKANGGIFGGIKLRQFNYLLNTLIYSLTETSPPGLEPGTKP